MSTIPKINRNDPCPCGSGRKYKLCCEPKYEKYVQLRRLDGELQEKLFEWADLHRETYSLNEAWSRYLGPIKGPDDTREIQGPLFALWSLYSWRPNGRESIAMSYARENWNQLTDLTRRFIALTCETPFTFMEILSVEPGRGLRVLDLFLRREMFVIDFSASRHVRLSCLILARVITFDDVTMFMGTSPIQLPTHHKLEMIRLRQAMEDEFGKITQDVLQDLFEFLHDVFRELAYPSDRSPKMVNFSGDLLEFHKLIYEHHSAEELLSRLQELGPSAKDMPAHVIRDNQGNLKKADFPWLSTARGKRNTVFGNFVITPDRLTVEVNSARRASIVCAMISRRAGKLVRLTEHGKKSLDEMLNQKAPRKSSEPIDVKSSPELLAYWHEYMTNHWSNWIHEKLPALNGKTPAQAVKTAKGRELVEELLNWMEKTAIDRPGMPSQKQFIDGARKQLGL